MIIKIIGFGFYESIESQYFLSVIKHPLHLIDFILILFSWILFVNYKIELTSFRFIFIIFYIPFPQLHILILSVWNSIKKLLFILLFFMLFYWVFAIFGIQYLSGILHNRCFISPIIVNESYSIDLTPNTNIDSIDSNIMDNFTSNLFCVYDENNWNKSNVINNYNENGCWQSSVYFGTNENYTHCLPIANNPLSGLYSFDNIYESLFTCFMISSGHWAILMSYAEEAYGHDLIAVYFFVLSFIFAFILLPLLLACMFLYSILLYFLLICLFCSAFLHDTD